MKMESLGGLFYCHPNLNCVYRECGEWIDMGDFTRPEMYNLTIGDAQNQGECSVEDFCYMVCITDCLVGVLFKTEENIGE